MLFGPSACTKVSFSFNYSWSMPVVSQNVLHRSSLCIWSKSLWILITKADLLFGILALFRISFCCDRGAYLVLSSLI